MARRKWFYWMGGRLCIIEELNRYWEWEEGQCVSMMGRGAKMSLESRQAKHGAASIILDLQLGSTKEFLSGKVCDHIN